MDPSDRVRVEMTERQIIIHSEGDNAMKYAREQLQEHEFNNGDVTSVHIEVVEGGENVVETSDETGNGSDKNTESPKEFNPTKARLEALQYLTDNDDETHSAKDLKEHVSVSSMSPMLSDLFDYGLVGRESEGAGGGWRYVYWITGAGRRFLEKHGSPQ